MAVYNINSQRLPIIPVPFDAKRCNFYVDGANVVIETVPEYLARITTDIRDLNPVTVLIPRAGYTAGTCPIGAFESILDGFDIKMYGFMEGFADENFIDVTDYYFNMMIPLAIPL